MSSTSALRAAPWTLAAVIVVIALNLRGPIVAPAPVIGAIRSDLGISAATAGLVTTIPVLCFALATPLASWLIGRFSPERAVTASLVVVLLGTVIRSGGSAAALLIGTAVIGVGITIGNVVIPVVIRRDSSPARVGLVTGVYTSALNVGSMITSLGTAPLATVVGWPVAIALWGVIVLIALGAWSVFAGRMAWRSGATVTEAGRASVPKTGPIDQVLDADAIRRPTNDPNAAPVPRAVIVGLLLAFGGQAFAYYALTAWIPTLLHDRIGFNPASAGASSSVFQILAVVGALGVPALATRWRPRAIIALIAVLWVAMPLGLLLAPHLWLVWEILGGAAQGGGITVIFIVIVRLVSNDDQARRTSAVVQGGGYLIGAAGPLVMGGLHEASNAWTVPLLVVFAATILLGVAGTAASRSVR
ncbi:MFS transporter [Curtobacterium ammoniigenes]|uniref:MFS transporter n=1 Tax=Curtobacterium ammoniigenes TaxID=395387 RepID=UPI00083631B3|nr:MFS transporter [Curtobacterium ammoniigenes]